jgi:methyltransferase (TIGR00027 family)
MGVAGLRAVHQIHDRPPAILEDPIALRLLDPETRSWVEAGGPALETPAARVLRAHVVTRSRFVEDRLARAIAQGISSYVILGAGYDTFAWRQPPWASGLDIFEVDEPATQADKRHRLSLANLPIPANLRFAAVDFEHESLPDALARSGFDAKQPALVAWLGVSMYLERATNDRVFSFVVSLPAGSELVFTFAARASTDDGVSPLAEWASRVGEPWRTYYAPHDLAVHLRTLGFSEVVIPSPAELAATYFAGRQDDLPPPRRRSIVSATV